MQTIITVGIVASFMISLEILFRRSKWPKSHFWYVRSVTLNTLQVLITYYCGLLWNQWFISLSIFSIESSLPFYATIAIGYLTFTFVFYWWHRARHTNPTLWRMFHQLHHSPKRIEVLTSFYNHPFDMATTNLISSTLLYFILGLDPITASIITAISGILSLVSHCNIKTPYIMGFFIQRPESHLIHHKLNWHQQNYSELPLWDMIFGTFNNAKDVNSECGFSGNKEMQLRNMIFWKDVNQV